MVIIDFEVQLKLVLHYLMNFVVTDRLTNNFNCKGDYTMGFDKYKYCKFQS